MRLLAFACCMVLASCGSMEPDRGVVHVAPYDGMPVSAVSMVTGVGNIEWRAERAGRMWVGDDDRGKLLVNRVVEKGDLVEVDVEHDRPRIRMNGETIYDQNLEAKHHHSVFFR